MFNQLGLDMDKILLGYINLLPEDKRESALEQFDEIKDSPERVKFNILKGYFIGEMEQVGVGSHLKGSSMSHDIGTWFNLSDPNTDIHEAAMEMLNVTEFISTENNGSSFFDKINYGEEILPQAIGAWVKNMEDNSKSSAFENLKLATFTSVVSKYGCSQQGQPYTIDDIQMKNNMMDVYNSLDQEETSQIFNRFIQYADYIKSNPEEFTKIAINASIEANGLGKTMELLLQDNEKASQEVYDYMSMLKSLPKENQENLVNSLFNIETSCDHEYLDPATIKYEITQESLKYGNSLQQNNDINSLPNNRSQEIDNQLQH
jgi:hypothetical protein